MFLRYLLPDSDFFHINETKENSFIKKVIEEAKKDFVPGGANMFWPSSSPDSTKRNSFARDADSIADSKLVAAAGPTYSEMDKFILDTAYNAYQPIRQIIALGTFTAYQDREEQDFYDYCLKERVENFQSCKVAIKRLSGEIHHSTSGNICYPDSIIQSKLEITSNDDRRPEELNVTLLPLLDGMYLDLERDFVSSESKKTLWKSDQIKEVLWDLFQKSLKESILIHCKKGLGRTGHIILMFEILKNYDSIFASSDPIKVAKKINVLVDKIRKNRPGLLLKTDQFSSAIYNAHILHKYALEKKYISESIQDKEFKDDTQENEPNEPSAVPVKDIKEKSSVNKYCNQFGLFAIGATCVAVTIGAKLYDSFYSPK